MNIKDAPIAYDDATIEAYAEENMLTLEEALDRMREPTADERAKFQAKPQSA